MLSYVAVSSLLAQGTAGAIVTAVSTLRDGAVVLLSLFVVSTLSDASLLVVSLLVLVIAETPVITSVSCRSASTLLSLSAVNTVPGDLSLSTLTISVMPVTTICQV